MVVAEDMPNNVCALKFSSFFKKPMLRCMDAKVFIA